MSNPRPRRMPKTIDDYAREAAAEQRRRHRELGYVAEGERLSFIAGNWSQVCPSLQCIRGSTFYALGRTRYVNKFVEKYNRLLAEEQANATENVSGVSSPQKA